MLKKLHILLNFSNLVVSNQVSRIFVDMRNFVAKSGKNLEICKKFAGNQVNEKGNVPRCGVVPTFSDVEVVALSITAEAMSIKLDVPYRLNQKNWTQPTWAYKRLRKRIETVFSQLNNHLMMIRNYAKKPSGHFARMEAKVAAFTVLQYFNLLNHKPIGQVKYALF